MDVKLIEIKQDMPGFNRFFSAWVFQDHLTFVVDVGPARSARRLIDSLASMGVDRLDYVFLTHIHIDHAGGLAALLDRYPKAKVLCHEMGVRFLAEPSKLWAGSQGVLGEIAEAYGPPRPILSEQIIPHTENPLKDLKIIETPGHAVHHLSFLYRGRLFAGEAGGNYCLVDGTDYLRPATPPKFFLHVCLGSIDRLLALEDQPIYYAHFGVGDSSHRLLKMYRDQLLRWKGVIYKQMQEGTQDLVERCTDVLIEEDPALGAFARMDPDTQSRERFFIANAVKGFLGFLRENP